MNLDHRVLRRINQFARTGAAGSNRLAAFTKRKLEEVESWKFFRRAEQHNHKLDAAMLARCRDYSIDVFGSDIYTPAFALYVSIFGAWRDGLIPERYLFRVVGPRKYGAWYDLSRAKTMTRLLFPGPFNPDIGTVFEGRFYLPDMAILAPSGVKDYLFAGRGRIIFKSDAGGRGVGIRFFTAQDFDVSVLAELDNGLFQTIIEPHEELAIPGVDALTTVRITTTLDSAGAIRLNYVNLRLGRAKCTHITSYESVRLDVDPRSGAWADTGYLKDWTPSKQHPDAPIRYAGRVVPELVNAIELCKRLHAKTPFMPSIGWDLCLNRLGKWELIEWNVPHGISFAEPVNGPVFAGLGWEQLWKQDAAR